MPTGYWGLGNKTAMIEIKVGDTVKIPMPFFNSDPVIGKVLEITEDKIHVKVRDRVWNREAKKSEMKEFFVWYYLKNAEKI